MNIQYILRLRMLSLNFKEICKMQFYLTQAPPCTGLFGCCSPPAITVTYLPTEICINKAAQQDKPAFLPTHCVNVPAVDHDLGNVLTNYISERANSLYPFPLPCFHIQLLHGPLVRLSQAMFFVCLSIHLPPCPSLLFLLRK